MVSLLLNSGTQLFAVIKHKNASQEYVLQQHIYFKKEYFMDFFFQQINTENFWCNTDASANRLKNSYSLQRSGGSKGWILSMGSINAL